MKIMRALATFLYVILFLIIGAALLSLALNIFSWQDMAETVSNIYAEPNTRLILGIIGVIFIFGALLRAQIDFGRMQREKTIAFENPDGEVTISLSAIEDFVKKSVDELREVKELRSNVTASKKGIDIVCKATIYADSNIPETTERIQAIVKSKVQEMLGVEEAINIKIHITKISGGNKEKPQSKPKFAEKYEEKPIPYRG
jgi:uncharacterized alkaline shock family protein YloU